MDDTLFNVLKEYIVYGLVKILQKAAIKVFDIKLDIINNDWKGSGRKKGY